METTALRLYGKNDLRLETFTLPPFAEDEILVKIISDSLCPSSYKAAIQGASHYRVPDDVYDNPTVIGHEFCGEIIEAGAKWAGQWKTGDKFSIQPALNYKGSPAAPGYSYKYLGGGMTYAILPHEVMETESLLKYDGDAFFYGSLAEPMSCIVGAFKANYHTRPGSYIHDMGIKAGGKTAILSGAGPMGLGAIDYALNGPIVPSVITVTDIAEDRLKRAAELFTDAAAKRGVKINFVNTNSVDDAAAHVIKLAGGGYDDVFVFAPVVPVVELGDSILGNDGCMSFFAGPTDPAFSAKMNFYNVHYKATHIVGTSGGNTEDMKDALFLMESKKINPAAMITHIGGLNAAAEATLNLPKIPGGKKLIYTHIDMPLTAIADMGGSSDPVLKEAYAIAAKHGGFWNAESEAFLLTNKQV